MWQNHILDNLKIIGFKKNYHISLADHILLLPAFKRIRQLYNLSAPLR